MSIAHKWKFAVKGTLTRGEDGPRLTAYDVIVNSGDSTGSHTWTGLGPIAHPDEDQLFCTWFFTEGSKGDIEVPESVVVSLRVARGEWKPYVVRVQASQSNVVASNEVHIDLGAIAIEMDQPVYVSEP